MIEVEYGVVLALSQNAKPRQAIKAMTGPTCRGITATENTI